MIKWLRSFLFHSDKDKQGYPKYKPDILNRHGDVVHLNPGFEDTIDNVTIDGKNPCPFPRMTDFDLWRYEDDYHVKNKTFTDEVLIERFEKIRKEIKK